MLGVQTSSLPLITFVGGSLLGTALTINNACSDVNSGKVSDTGTYFKSGFVGGFVGGIITATSTGLMAECTLLTQKFLTALSDAAGVDIDGSGEKEAIDVIIGNWLEEALGN